jgi:hypothetical protein
MMEILFVLIAVCFVIFVVFLFKGSSGGRQPPQPSDPESLPKTMTSSTGGASTYLQKNLAHIPPQGTRGRSASKSLTEDSIYLDSSRWDELLVADEEGLPNLYLQWHDDELWLTEATTGLLLKVANGRLRRMGIWTVKVRGVNYHEEAVRQGAFQPGAPVFLKREPENVHDKNAVALYATGAEEKCGYFNKAMAGGMSKLIESGVPLRAVALAGSPAGSIGNHDFSIKVLAGSPEIVAHLLRKTFPTDEGRPRP